MTKAQLAELFDLLILVRNCGDEELLQDAIDIVALAASETQEAE